jgi:hypothetical protein
MEGAGGGGVSGGCGELGQRLASRAGSLAGWGRGTPDVERATHSLEPRRARMRETQERGWGPATLIEETSVFRRMGVGPHEHKKR